MSKLTRQQLILQLIENGNVANQEDLRRASCKPHQGDACLMGQQLQTAVVGATGYAGFELARLLGQHPRLAKPLLFTRESGSSADLTEYYPHVLGNGQLRVDPFDWQSLSDQAVDVLFLATPHATSREWAPEA